MIVNVPRAIVGALGRFVFRTPTRSWWVCSSFAALGIVLPGGVALVGGKPLMRIGLAATAVVYAMAMGLLIRARRRGTWSDFCQASASMFDDM